MELFEDTDNTTKNIVHEILRESLKQNLIINEGYCIFYVKLLTLDPKWGISSEKKINRDQIQALVSWIIGKFAEVECLSLTTITMQQYFIFKYTTREKLIKNHYNLINSILEPLVVSITDITVEYMQHNKSRIVKRMTLFIILASKMGDIKDHMVLRETFQALKSIIDDDDLNDYAKMSEKEKRTELIYKQKVVMGIRLFNSDSGRNIGVIADLPKIIQQSANVMQCELQKALCRIMDTVNLTTTAIESVFEYKISNSNQSTIFDVDEKESVKAAVNLPEGVSYEDLERILNILVLARQHEVYLRKFLLDIKVIQENVNILSKYLKEIISKLHSSVKYKIAVMASTVFPLFVELGEIWINIQEEAIVFSHLIKVFKHLEGLTNSININKETITLMIGDNPIMTDAMRLEKTTGIRIGQLLSADCQILDPLEIEDFENLHLEFLGFCAWKFILTNGALIPGNPNMGVLKWDDKYFVFSVPEAATYFAQDPKDMIMNALLIARKKPELITLLQMQQQIYKIRNLELKKDKVFGIKKSFHKKIQTETHPIEPFIDKKFEWNTWKMLNESLILANISRCQTHSTQTNLSHLRYHAGVQTTKQKDKNVQTKKDNYTNTATVSNYQFGYRGRKDKLQHTIDLTCPIKEDVFNANIKPIEHEKRNRNIKVAKKSLTRKSNTSKTISSIDNKQISSSIDLSLIGSNLCVCELSTPLPESEGSI